MGADAASVSIEYDRALVRRALNLYVFRRLGPLSFVALALVAASLAFTLATDSWTWVDSLMSCVVAVFIGLVALAYVTRWRASSAFFGGAERASVDFDFDEEGVRMRSHMGESMLVWGAFDEILRFDGLWLLVYARSGYVTLPLEQVPEGCRALIASRVGSADASRSLS